jgi:hypothetical protein
MPKKGTACLWKKHLETESSEWQPQSQMAYRFAIKGYGQRGNGMSCQSRGASTPILTPLPLL